MKKLMILIGVAMMVWTGVAQASGSSWPSEMVSLSHIGAVDGVQFEIRESPNLPSPGETTLTDLGGGAWQVDSFFNVFTEISEDGGPWEPGPQGTMVKRLHFNTRVITSTIPVPEKVEVEILALSLVGEVGGVRVEIRQDPSLPSPGQTTLTELGEGYWEVDSFFDVSTEITVDTNPPVIGPDASVQTGGILSTNDPNEYKWLQEPDIQYGFDIWSWGYEDPQTGQVTIANEVADDWVCQDGRNITDIHWWGSFKGYREDEMGVPQGGSAIPHPSQEELPMYFILSMHEDVPNTASQEPYSHPGMLIREEIIPIEDVTINYFWTNYKIDHTTGQIINERWEHEYEFHVDLMDSWTQTQGNIYWLDVVAVYPGESSKWLQQPDIEYGYDILSYGTYDPQDTSSYVITSHAADDWVCRNGNPITKIRWWGSFDKWNEDTYTYPAAGGPLMPPYFLMSMHEDVPVGQEPIYPYSTPDTQMIQRVMVYAGNISAAYFDVNPKIDHVTGETITGLWEHEFEFELTLDNPWPQEKGKIYWLNVVAMYPNTLPLPQYLFGWKTADPNQPPPDSWLGWIDDGVVGLTGDLGGGFLWYELRYGSINDSNSATGLNYFGGWNGYWNESINLAFELIADPENSKWYQGPDTEYGYDIWSWGRELIPGDPNSIILQNAVADDWICRNGLPITRIRWWGSFKDWTEDTAQTPPLPDYFILSMHEDDRIKYNYSAPLDPLIRRLRIPPSAVSWRYFDSNPIINHATGQIIMPIQWEHEYEFEVDLTDTSITNQPGFEPWSQEEGKIYWLDVVAIYYSDPLYYFGWKTADPLQDAPDSEFGWIDDAVSSNDPWDTSSPGGSLYPPPNWYEMVYGPTGVINPANSLHYAGGWWEYKDTSTNMAFELFTDWEPPHVFGWKTADPTQVWPDENLGWIDDAVSSALPGEDDTTTYPPGTWYEMTYGSLGGGFWPPYYYGGYSGYWYQSINMAYGLTTEPIPPDKWTQLPDTYFGYDIWSWGHIDANDSITIINEVAEDWRCLGGKAITNVTWWGSFDGYKESIPGGDTIPVPDKDVLPVAFLLSWHYDIPAGQGNYSSPGTEIDSAVIPIKKVKIKYFDTNSKIDHYSGIAYNTYLWEHEFEFHVNLEEVWDQQKGTIYWIDIVALYENVDTAVKWDQPPDMTTNQGIDIRAEHPVVNGGQIVADDWKCNDPRPVVALRWWGSYLNEFLEHANITTFPFEISWHFGDSTPPPTSSPGWLIRKDLVYAVETFFGTDGNGKNVYQYDVTLPRQFSQEEDQIYWIDIELDVDTLEWPSNAWGWHNTISPWRDQASTSTTSHTGPWTKIEPDMSFQLIVGGVVNKFGWKTADPNQTLPNGQDWIDDAVSSNPGGVAPAPVPYPPPTWYEMRYGLPTGGYYGGIEGYHYPLGGGSNPSIGMAFMLNTDPVLKIKKSPANSGDAWLIPILDPSVGFVIWSNLNMVDISDTTWSLLGTYPAGTTTVVDTGAISDTTTDKKFYYLEE